MTTSFEVSKSLYLVVQPKPGDVKPAPKETPTNHLMIVDVSGSMWGEVDRIRDHLKAKLPKMMKKNDTFSLIAFSGRGQVYRILTGEAIASLPDLSKVNETIDRWLRCVGATGFKEPIEEITKVVADIAKINQNPLSVFFLTDGYDNAWPRQEVLKAVEKTASLVSAATVVSYGHYADLPFLTQIAEKWGGNLIVSDNFTKFTPALEASLQKVVLGGKRVELKIEGDAVGGFAYALDGTDLVTFSIEDGKVSVPESVTEIAYLAPKSVGKAPQSLGDIAAKMSPNHDGSLVKGADKALSLAYGAVSLFAVRMMPDVVLDLLKATGDVTYIESFSTLFGKQKYAEFQEATKDAAINTSKRWEKGYDPKKVPREDAFTVLDFLEVIQKDDENKVLLSDPRFAYKRIGRETVDANTRLTKEESEELKLLTDELSKEKDLAKIKEINVKVAALTNKPEPLKFVESQEGKDEGYSVNKVVFNEDRPNISISVSKKGTVDLSSRLPEEFKGNTLGKIPEVFPTNIFRTYTIVQDALNNVPVLPTRLSAATKKELAEVVKSGRLPAEAITEDGDVTLVKFSMMPLTNRQKTQKISARKLFETQWELTKAQAAQKVYNSYLKEAFPGKTSESYKALYGDAGSAWLAEQGITDYSGFGPKRVVTPPTDEYMAKYLEVKIKNYSTIPSLNDYRKQVAKGKLNGPAELMKPVVEAVEAFKTSKAYMAADEAGQAAMFEAYLKKSAKDTTEKVRGFLFEVAQIKMNIIVSQTWFTEFKSLEENSLDLTLDGTKLNFTAALSEKPERI